LQRYWLDWFAFLAPPPHLQASSSPHAGAGPFDRFAALSQGRAHLDVALGLSDSPGMRLTHYPPLFSGVLSLGRFCRSIPGRWRDAETPSLMALSTIRPA